MKKILQQILANKARRFLQKHSPIIIGVTGSVGKTSTRHAIATLLSAKFRVVTSKENYNNEIGLPLSILNVQSPGKNLLGWIKILCLSPKPADVYVLEYAVDHPGDIDYLCSIAKPSIAVLTAISPVHVEFFSSLEALAEEKAKLLEVVPENGLAVINADDSLAIGLGAHAHSPITTYGFRDTADVRAMDYTIETRSDFSFQPNEQFSEIHFRVKTPEESIVVTLTNQLGKSAVSSVLAAIVVARSLGLSWDEILAKANAIKNEPGRMNPIAGIKGSLIIDSTYNAAPASMQAALNVLRDFFPTEGARRIAVLGHMAELGFHTEDEHRLLGLAVAEHGVDFLLTVGDAANIIRRGAIEAGMDETQALQFADPESAGRFLDANIKTGDIILVKGSQSARMEKVVKDIMAEPLRASELLVRQSDKWTTM